MLGNAKAQVVFDELPIQDLVSWNSLISGYVRHGHNEGVLKCFKHMRRDGFLPKCHHFYLSILKACGIHRGKQIYHEIIHMK